MNNKIKIEEWPVERLRPYENNPRKNDDAVGAVAASIREFGFKVPIIVDKNGVIVAGHTRLKAAKMLGLAAVPVVVADDLTPEQVRAFRLADNKTSELAGWDFQKMREELLEIQDIDMMEFGFMIDDIREFGEPELTNEDNTVGELAEDGDGDSQVKEVRCPRCGALVEAKRA